MKKFFSVAAFVLLGFAVSHAQNGTTQTQQPQTQQEKPATSVKFTESVHDFGTVDYNSDVSFSFVFKNVSHSPVAVKDVQTSCGCTTPGYSKEPVMPGKTGAVTAKYDSSRIGAFTKTLTVHINDETYYLTIKGTIKEPASGK